MRYNNIACPPGHQRIVASLRRAAAALGLKSGFVTAARRAATPYVVDCPTLAREVIGDAEFERQYTERRDWCHDRCYMDHEIEPIRDDQMRLTGRRFRFSNETDAALFRTFFC
jgi:hypothetical protein